MLAVRLFIWAAMTWTPARVQWPELAIVLLALIAAATHVFILTRAVRVR
jgi:hypothetical protein